MVGYGVAECDPDDWGGYKAWSWTLDVLLRIVHQPILFQSMTSPTHLFPVQPWIAHQSFSSPVMSHVAGASVGRDPRADKVEPSQFLLGESPEPHSQTRLATWQQSDLRPGLNLSLCDKLSQTVLSVGWLFETLFFPWLNVSDLAAIFPIIFALQ